MRNTKPRVGKVEQTILAALARLSVNSYALGADLAHLLYRDVATEANKASVRRAVLRLRAKGLIVKDGPGWVLTKKQREAERQERRRAEARWRAEADARAHARAGNLFDPEPRRSDPVTARLAQLLGMLGSTHEGEVLAAARKIERERQRLGRTWQELLGVTEP